jgi:hypothetical protein
MADLKMGKPDEIIDVMRNRRQTKKLVIGTTKKFPIIRNNLETIFINNTYFRYCPFFNCFLEKNSLIDAFAPKKPVGGVGLPAFGLGGIGGVVLRKVEKNDEKKTEPEKEQKNLDYVNKLLIQGEVRKSKLRIVINGKSFSFKNYQT